MIDSRKFPENIEVEKIIIGAAINSEEDRNKVLTSLNIDDFFEIKNKIIFQAIYNLSYSSKSVNVTNLTIELKNQKKFNKDGIDIIYLRDLTKSVILSNKISEYINILRNTTILRNIFKLMNETESNFFSDNYKIGSYDSFITGIKKKFDNIFEQKKIATFVSSKKIVEETRQYIKKISINEKVLTGFNTGFYSLNECTDGLQKQNLIIIAGRTGVGKTSLALNIALNISLIDEIPIAIFSMEMSYIHLFIRLISINSGIDSQKILRGKLSSDHELLSVDNTLKKLEKSKIYVDESSVLTISNLITKIKILKTEQPNLGLVVIDYLGLISKEENKKTENRHLEIQEYTRKIHELARELDLSIILLCQLNRKIDDRNDGKPKLSDLRESGSIEQDAELVFLMYESVNNNMNNINENDTINKKNNVNEKIVNIKVAKNRNGISGYDIQLIFERNFSRFFCDNNTSLI